VPPLKQILSDLTALVSYVAITPIARLIPKHPASVIIFAPENGGFSDNAKYAYLALTEDQRFNVTYILYDDTIAKALRDAGINALAYPSLAAVWTMLRARVAVGVALFPFRRTLGRWTAGAKKVQLWHGSGVKNIGLGNPTNVKRSESRYYRFKWAIDRMHPTFDLLFLPSNQLRKWRGHSFRSNDIVINGLLRNDLLFGRSFGGREQLFCDTQVGSQIAQKKAAGKRIILYAPTFRSRSQQIFERLVPFDFDWFNLYSRHNNAALVIKLHPHMPDTLDLRLYENIIEYDRKLDIYPYLSNFDLMITDFSSFATDFALTGKPIMRYVPDYARWERSGRISASSSAELPGELFQTFDKMSEALTSKFPSESYSASAFHDFTDDQSCNRFVSKIEELLKLSGDVQRSHD